MEATSVARPRISGPEAWRQREAYARRERRAGLVKNKGCRAPAGTEAQQPEKAQKMNFSANCTWRAEPESPAAERVFWIFPKAVESIFVPLVAVPLASVMVPNEAFGTHVPAGNVWLGIEATLNATDDGLQLPPGWPKFGWLKILNTSVRNSIWYRSVIRVLFRMEKSKLLKPGPVTRPLRPRLPNCPAAGRANASGLKKWAGSCVETVGLPTTLGRTVAATLVSGETPLSVMVSGLPLCRLVLPDNAQPSTSRLPCKGSS